MTVMFMHWKRKQKIWVNMFKHQPQYSYSTLPNLALSRYNKITLKARPIIFAEFERH